MKTQKFTINYSLPVADRVKAANKELPWIINVHERTIDEHRYDRNENYLSGEKEYPYKLFHFPEGASTKMIRYQIRREKWLPANPAHMLAFASGGFKHMPELPYGVWHRYLVGLGGTLHTVLGAQFGGLNTGTTFFFRHVSQDKPMHQGGRDCWFLAVREFWR